MTPLTEIKSICQRYATPAVNVGAHALACRILRIIHHYEAELTRKTKTHPRQGTDKPDGTEEKSCCE